MLNMLGAGSVSPAALWVAIALVVIAVLVFAKNAVRIIVIIVMAAIIYALKTNGLL